MDERPLRVGSVFEWIAAAAGVVLLVWVISVPVQRVIGPRVEAALVETSARLPPGVPAGATGVPVMLLLDGREIRQGELYSRVSGILPEKLADAPPVVSASEFGERRTHSFAVDGVRLYLVSERLERSGPVRVTGIFLP